MDAQGVTLSTIANGAVEERFQRDLDDMLRNIEDENTPAKQKRSILIEIEIQPNEDRKVGIISIRSKLKLAHLKPLGRQWFFGRQHGVPIAVENNIDQKELFDATPARPRLVEEDV